MKPLFVFSLCVYLEISKYRGTFLEIKHFVNDFSQIWSETAHKTLPLFLYIWKFHGMAYPQMLTMAQNQWYRAALLTGPDKADIE